MYYNWVKLSVSDVIVSQKGTNGDRKLHFFGRDYSFTSSLCAKIHLWAKIPNSERLKMMLKYECVPLILTKHAIKKDSKETYSIVRKGHKIKPE